MSAIEETQDRPLQSENADDPNFAEFTRLKKEITDAQRHRSDWRKEAMKCYDYVASHQWSEDDKAELDSQHRPAITFNRTAPLIKAVCGLEVNNRQGIIYLPREQGDVGFNETITNTGKWVRDECNAEDEESEAFRDVTICGEGWTEMRMDYEEDPNGYICKERIDPLEMGVNKGAMKTLRSNYSDARMIYRIRKMHPDDVRALLNLSDDLEAAAMDASAWVDTGSVPADGGKGNKKDYPKETRAGVAGSKTDRDIITVVQCQYWKRVRVHMVATAEDEQPQELDDAQWGEFQQRAEMLKQTGAPLEFSHAQVTRKKYYQCFIGIRILDTQELKMGMFQFTAMTGERDRKEECFYGMVRDMIDPQMWANKWLSQTMHIMNSNAKGGLLAETDAFQNVRKAEREWSDPTKITWVKPGALAKNKIKEKQVAQLPPGLDQLMMFAISSIRDVTGINLELLGQADREQAASLEQQRRQSAMTILATMFDSLRRYRKRDGKLMLHFIWLLPDGTLVRVLEQGQYKYIPLMKQGLEKEKFDIIIDQAPTSPDQKQFVWAITAQILQMNILPPAAIIELLKYSPYPESVVQEIRKAMGLDGEMPPDQLQERLKQAEGALQFMEQKLQEEMAKTKEIQDDKAIEMLKLEIEEYKAETLRLKEQWAARVDKADTIVRAHQQTTGPDGQVTTGSIELPDLGGVGEGNEAQPSGLEQKVDQLTDMVTQLIQAFGGGQQAPAPEQAFVEQQPAVGEE